jgi:hypothetical protein
MEFLEVTHDWMGKGVLELYNKNGTARGRSLVGAIELDVPEAADV